MSITPDEARSRNRADQTAVLKDNMLTINGSSHDGSLFLPQDIGETSAKAIRYVAKGNSRQWSEIASVTSVDGGKFDLFCQCDPYLGKRMRWLYTVLSGTCANYTAYRLTI